MSDAGLQSLWAFTVAIFAVGGCIGGVSNGYFANKFGRSSPYHISIYLFLYLRLYLYRRQSLLYNNILAIIGALLMGLSEKCNSYEMLIFGRFVIGINCGMFQKQSNKIIYFEKKTIFKRAQHWSMPTIHSRIIASVNKRLSWLFISTRRYYFTFIISSTWFEFCIRQ